MINFKELVTSAIAAKDLAFAPYSHFNVGAALLTASGKIYTGCNIESSSYGLSMCAERVALFKALSEGEKDFLAMAISSSAKTFCSPCGACRQVMWDFGPEIKVVLISSPNNYQIFQMSDLFTYAFDKNTLTDNAE